MKTTITNEFPTGSMKSAAKFHWLFVLFFLICSKAANSQTTDFVSKWKTNNSGVSSSVQITIPCFGSGYNYNVDWGDASTSTGLTASTTHTYASAGTYTVRISGTFPRIFFNGSGDRLKILSIEQWGSSMAWKSFQNAFLGCQNLQINATDAPDLSAVTDMSHMFENCFNLNADLSSWNTSNIVSLNSTFTGCTSFNKSLNSWDVSNVTDLSATFSGCSVYNQPMDNWNTSKVTTLFETFRNAVAFNGNITTWNTSNVTTLSNTFYNANKFNQNINNWDVSKVTSLSQTFLQNQVFNQPLNNWNTGNVTTMRATFYGAEAFNQNINSWDVSKVTDLSFTFLGCSAYNQPMNSWNTSNVTTLFETFRNAVVFNGDITTWNTSKVTSMVNTFYNASKFNQNLNNWDVSQVTSLWQTFYANKVFNQPLNNWNTGKVTSLRGTFSGAEAFNQNINSWDVSLVTDMGSTFAGASVFNQPLNNWNTANNTSLFQTFLNAFAFNGDITTWNTGNVVNMQQTFNGALVFNQNINSWDVSKVTTLYYTFGNAKAFNQPLNNWNTSNVTTLLGTFNNALAFNQNINSWNVNKVTDMSLTFAGATVFNQPLNNWNTANNTSLYQTFLNAFAFNGDITSWNTSKVTTMTQTFNAATVFNQNINSWDISKVTSLMFTFRDAKAFNQPLNNWSTSNVTTLYATFNNAVLFNQNINTWDVGKVTDMALTFSGAKVFNQPLNNWNTSKVTNFFQTFFNATAFNQNIANWDVSASVNFTSTFEGAAAFNYALGNWSFPLATTMASMLSNSGLGLNQYDSTLTAWYYKPHPKSISLGAIGRKYCKSLPERILFTRSVSTGGEGWTITGDIQNCAPGGVGTNLGLWLKADAGLMNNKSMVNSGAVGSWFSSAPSANLDSLGQVNNAQKPAAIPNAINFNSALRFDGVNDNLFRNNISSNLFRKASGSDRGSYNYFIVGNFKNTSNTIAGFEKNTGVINQTIFSTDKVTMQDTHPVGVAKTVSFTYSNPLSNVQIGAIRYESGSNSSKGITIRINGVNKGSAQDSLRLNSATGNFTIGSNSAGTDFFNGDICEIIAYPTANTNVSRLESYLALKYGITLNPGVSANYENSAGGFFWQGNSSYQNNIFGIGRDDNGAINQQISKSVNSDAIVTISTDSDLSSANGTHRAINSDLSFLTIGDNNANSGTYLEISTDFPDSLNNKSCTVTRLSREWKSQLSNFNNAIQTISMQFDLNGYTITGTSFKHFYLMIDNDGDGNFKTGTVQYIQANSFNSNKVVFNGINSLIHNAVFTLITYYNPVSASLVSSSEKTSIAECGTSGWLRILDPSDNTKAIAAIRLKGNTINPSDISVTINNAIPLSSLGFASSANNQASQIMNRFVTVTCPTCNLTAGGGVDLRMYWNPAEKTNTLTALDNLKTSQGVSGSNSWNFYKVEGTVADILNNASYKGLGFDTGRLWNTPDSSGIEDGIDFIEFRGLKSFSTFGGIGFTNLLTPLPMELLSFEVSKFSLNSAKLTWKTASEIQTDYFEIQRSDNGKNWVKIGSVKAAGNSNEIKQYNFVDAKIMEGVNYYRLKLYNQDGTHSFSEIRAADFRFQYDINWKVNPNPTAGEIVITNLEEAIANGVEITDMAGRKLIPAFTTAEGHTIRLNISNLSEGMYLLHYKGKTVKIYKN